MPPAIGDLSADSRQLFAGKHIDNTGAADASFHHDKAGLVARDFADDGGVLTKGMRSWRSTQDRHLARQDRVVGGEHGGP